MAFPPYTKTFHTNFYDAISPSRPDLSTAGKVILITGGGSGIGPRVTHAFAASGSTRIAILGRTASSLLSTKKDVETQYPGSKVLTFVANITDKAAVTSAFEETKKQFGAIDIFVSNAAYLPNGEPIATADVDEWFRGMEVNVKGNLILSQAFLANSSKNPVYIAVNTAGAHIPAIPFPLSAYATSKFALIKLMDYLAAENPHVRVMQVHPGALQTEMNKKGADAGFSVPFDDIELAAGFLVWAASPEAEFLKGKFLWSNWDVNDLLEKKNELVDSANLTVGLIGWP